MCLNGHSRYYRTQKAAEISERYRLLSMRARDIILFFRLNGQIVDANQVAVETYGYEQADLLQMRVHDLRAPETLDILDEQLIKANSGGLQFETIHRCKDGTTFPVELLRSVRTSAANAF